MKTLQVWETPFAGWVFPLEDWGDSFDRESLIIELASAKADPTDKAEWAEALLHYELLSDLELMSAYKDLDSY